VQIGTPLTNEHYLCAHEGEFLYIIKRLYKRTKV